tara:strand:+ start:4977 stop:5375 length:399 start_codon:yes stop_codon:yes gene_type:complete
MTELPCKKISGKVGIQVKYIKTFPENWINEDHIRHTGPCYCNNCRYHGSFKGIFLGYCLNCAEYIYNFSRGPGLPVKDILGNPIYNFTLETFPFNEFPYLKYYENTLKDEFQKITPGFPYPPVLKRSFATDP